MFTGSNLRFIVALISFVHFFFFFFSFLLLFLSIIITTFDSPTFASYRCFFNDVVKRQILR